jgi:hypothetical protein
MEKKTQTTKISKTLIQVEDQIAVCDTIEHAGQLWLVPEWLRGPIPGTEKPARLISLHGLPKQPPIGEYAAMADRHLIIPLSRDTLSGGTAQGLVVVEAPDIIRNVVH